MSEVKSDDLGELRVDGAIGYASISSKDINIPEVAAVLSQFIQCDCKCAGGSSAS